MPQVNIAQLCMLAAPWTIQSMEFSRPEYWNGRPFPSPGDLPNPGIKPKSPTLKVDSLQAEPQGKAKGETIKFYHITPLLNTLYMALHSA